MRHGVDDGGIRLALRLALNVGGKQLRAVDDALGTLQPRCRGGNESGRQRRRAGRHGVALDDQNLDAGFCRSQRRAQPGRAGADDQERHLDLEIGVE